MTLSVIGGATVVVAAGATVTVVGACGTVDGTVLLVVLLTVGGSLVMTASGAARATVARGEWTRARAATKARATRATSVPAAASQRPLMPLIVTFDRQSPLRSVVFSDVWAISGH
jgi:hypothetical protein